MSVNLGPVIRDYNQKLNDCIEKNALAGNQDFPMLRLTKENGKKKLEVVLHSQTSKLERFLKWIGVGPLSPKGVSKYLHQHQDELACLTGKEVKKAEEEPEWIEGELHEELYVEGKLYEEGKPIELEEVEKFARGLLRQYVTYNAHRPINRVGAVERMAIDHLAWPTFAIQDNTYEPVDQVDRNQGNIDFCGAGPTFAYVADSISHGKTEKKKGLVPVYEQFNASYEKALAKKDFKSVGEVTEFMKAQLNTLARAIGEKDDPAFSLVQVADIEGSLFAVTAQIADTFIMVKRGDELTFLKEHNPNETGLQSLNNIVYSTIPDVHPDDEFFVVSDGIGEFLTEKKIKEVVLHNKNRPLLLSELRDVIVSEEWKESLLPLLDEEREGLQAFGGRKLKIHNWDGSSSDFDDLSMAYLRVRPSISG